MKGTARKRYNKRDRELRMTIRMVGVGWKTFHGGPRKVTDKISHFEKFLDGDNIVVTTMSRKRFPQFPPIVLGKP